MHTLAQVVEGVLGRAQRATPEVLHAFQRRHAGPVGPDWKRLPPAENEVVFAGVEYDAGMIVGLGLDVCSIERMRRALDRHGDRFFARICSETERGELAGRDTATALAGRFAVKEAFAKALDGAPGVGWHEVEVRRMANGRPKLELRGKALEMAQGAGASRWHVTITHDAGIAAAVVVLEGP